MEEEFVYNDVREALKSLRNHYYSEKYDLWTRDKVFRWNDQRIYRFTRELNSGFQSLRKYFLEIDLLHYPKSYNDPTELLSTSNFYTSFSSDSPPIVTDTLTMIDAPVEIHLISVLWLRKSGVLLDRKLTNNCYGNRLEYPDFNAKKIFRSYQKEYKSWWKDALNQSKKSLSKGRNVSLFVFDLKSFYHSIEFSFASIDGLNRYDNSYKINRYFIEIHKHYKRKIRLLENLPITQEPAKYPLPIGLMSSPVLANYFLQDFDRDVTKTKPAFFGRGLTPYKPDKITWVKESC